MNILNLLFYPFNYLLYLLHLAMWKARHRPHPRSSSPSLQNRGLKGVSSKPRFRLLFAAILLLALIPTAYYLTKIPSSASAGWFDDSWGYRQRIPISNTSGSAKTDFQLDLSLDTATLIAANKLQSDCDDIRLTDPTGKLLAHWIEPTTCNTAATKVWVKIPSIPTGTVATDLYFYYGNPAASSGQAATHDVFLRDMESATVAWPLDDTDTSQSYARVTNPYDAEGRNILDNGTFDSASGWTVNSGWSITGGKAVANAVATNVQLIRGTVAAQGKVYNITYTISDYVSGTVRIEFGSGSTTTERNGNGTYSEYLKVTPGNSMFAIEGGSSAFTGNIDNVTVTQINIPASPNIPASELLTDGDMEAAETSSWSIDFSSSTPTKKTTNPHGGSQLMRVTATGSGPARATVYQTILTTGQTYRIHGYARSDGTAAPRVMHGNTSNNVWTGTTSTSWQPFDVVIVVSGANFYLGANSNVANQYVEFDDVSVTLDTSIRQSEIAQDGNMELAGTTYWNSNAGAILTKETTSPHGGSQVLRIARNGFDTSTAYQAFTPGKTYRMTGWTRSDGSAIPRVGNTSGGLYFNGTTSNSWQYFDASFVFSTGFTGPSTYATVDDQYTEFDDISIAELPPLVGTFNQSSAYKPILATPSNGHLSYAYSFDGSNDYVNIYSSDLNSVLNPEEGSLVAWAKVSGSDVWTDNTSRYIVNFATNTSPQDRIYINKTTTNNLLQYGFYAEGTNKTVNYTTSGETDWIQVAITWNTTADEMKSYFNGVQVETTQTGLSTWVANLASDKVNIGRRDTTGNYWSGLINDVRLYPRALSAEDIAYLCSANSDRQAYHTVNYPGHELIRQYDSAVTTGTPATEELGPGPVAYWSFDEGADNSCRNGKDACDSTPNSNDGTFANTTASPTWATEDRCISGKCLKFDGGDFLTTTTNKLSVSKGSISLWFNTHSTTSQQVFFSHNKNPGTTDRIYLGIDATAHPYVALGDDSNPKVATTTISANTWNHLTLSWNSGTYYLYLNGNQIKTGGYNNLTNIDSCMTIGAYNYCGGSGGSFTNGFIDEVKIYPYARSADEIKQDYLIGAAAAGSSVTFGNQDTGFLNESLVGYWKMDETSGTTVGDSSGNGNTGTLTNAQETGTSDASGNTTTTLVDSDSAVLSTTDDAYNGMILRFTAACSSITSGTERVITGYTGATKTITVSTALASAPDNCSYEIRHQVGGKFGSGITFDGSGSNIGDDYVIASSIGRDINESRFVSVWFKVDSILGNDWTGVVAPIRGNLSTLQFWGNTGRLNARPCKATDNAGILSGKTLTSTDIGVWHHVAYGYDQNHDSIYYYFDGELLEEKELNGIGCDAWTSGNSLIIGGLQSGTAPKTFDGTIDEVRIYNRALSESEVADLYTWVPGPIAHWKLDETTGTTAYDSSGNGWNGTLTNNPIWVKGKYGSAVQFSGSGGTGGTNDHIIVTTSTIFNTQTNFTISAWVNGNSFESQRYIAVAAGYHVGLSNSLGGGSVCLTHWNGFLSRITACDSSPSTQTWTHYSGVYMGDPSSGTLYLYKNGQLAQSTPITNPTSKGQFRIGGLPTTSNYIFDGSIDDVRIYNYARTQEQILEDMYAGHPINTVESPLPDTKVTLGGNTESADLSDGAGNPPIAEWKLDEKTGATIADSSGSGNEGAITGAIWKSSKDCKEGACLSFESDDTIEVSASNLDVSTNDQITLEAWIYPTSLSGLQMILDRQTSYYISANGSNLFCKIFITPSGQPTTSFSGLTLNQWNHVACTYDGTSFVGYINGVRDTPDATSGEINPGSNNVNIGSSSVQSYYFNGLIDHVKIYNYARTPAQIAYDYNRGAPIAHWKMDECQGTTIHDSAGANHGTLNLGTSGITSPGTCRTASTTWGNGASGKYSSAMSFDGSDDYLQLDTPLLENKTQLTVSVWIKPTTLGNNDTIIGEYSPGSIFGFMADGSFKFYNNTNNYSTETPITTGIWQHLTYVFNGSQDSIKFYHDGSFVEELTGVGASLRSSGINSEIAARSDGTVDQFNGLIDDLKIYNYTLSPTQVKKEFNAGSSIHFE